MENLGLRRVAQAFSSVGQVGKKYRCPNMVILSHWLVPNIPGGEVS